jgi:hypothetical protein
MGEIKLLDGRDQSGNPLTLLTTGIAELLAPLREIAKNTRTQHHVYCLSSAGSGSKGWGVYCDACSANAQAYTWPCQLAIEGEATPPQFFVMDKPETVDKDVVA